MNNRRETNSADYYLMKEGVLSRKLDPNSLPSSEIKLLLEHLEWSNQREKRLIIDLCRIISSRGDSNLITGAQ